VGMIAATHIALSTGKLDSVTAGRITIRDWFCRLPRMTLQTTSILRRLRSIRRRGREWCTLFCRARWQG